MRYVNNNHQTVAEQAYTQQRRKPKATRASAPVYPQRVTIGESRGFRVALQNFKVEGFVAMGLIHETHPQAQYRHWMLRNLHLALSISFN